ncbi:MAG: hypothetical protein ACI8PZ_006811, partial [Myxococcota bacterium]
MRALTLGLALVVGLPAMAGPGPPCWIGAQPEAEMRLVVF